jgi:hypothetical protein
MGRVFSRSRRVWPAPTLSDGICTDVTMFGVRGSFERYDEHYLGMGPTVSTVVGRATALLDTRGSTLTLSHCGVNYPANAWVFFRSRRLGVTTLTSLLTDAAQRCPEQRSVLVGLSLGAEVVCGVLATAPRKATDRLAAVVLLGDPSRRPGDPWQHGTTDPHPGIAARVAIDVPSEFHDRMWGYTLDGDEVSANHSGLRGLFRSGTHTLYQHNRNGVQDQAALFIANRLFPGRSDEICSA